MGLALSCKVFGVPTIWTTGTCSEKAVQSDDGVSDGISELEIAHTSSNTVDSTQFPDAKSEKKAERIGPLMT